MAIDPALEGRFRDLDLSHARERAKIEQQVHDLRASHMALERDIFGSRDRPNDVGIIGELRKEIAAMRSEVKNAKLWLQGLFGTLVVGMLVAIIYIIADKHP